tara:strand:+ start:1275 stop:3440 length:2166 start_codon:yes stop_codon:yes gene_type:complete
VATFLLEIGTEELPADFCKAITTQFNEMITKDLDQGRFCFMRIECNVTPRRISILINGLADSSVDLFEEKKGPPVSQAFVDGLPTKAAIGFANRYNRDVSDLIVKNTKKGDFVFIDVVEKGASSLDYLSNQIPTWIETIIGKRFMRWGDNEMKFSRPIRWIVSLLDDNPLSFRINKIEPIITSNNLTRGHRLFKQDILIDHANNYYHILSCAGVIVEREVRRNNIINMVNQIAENLNCSFDLNDKLLDELTDLVENPNIILGSFDPIYLKLPYELLSTVMRVHQRYIPLYKENVDIDTLSLKSESIMLSQFICISNGLQSSAETIKIGNEKVLRARLADAEFFINDDLSVKCFDRCEKLKNVTFSEGLGNLFDRSIRIKEISMLLVEELNINNLIEEVISKAALLCKHDLVSQIVGEFPELQGLMGGKYLFAEGYSRDISRAVSDHYRPRFHGDKLPETIYGSIIAIADKLDSLTSIFAKGERPTGSSDPFALRRAANGIFQIVWEQKWNINLNFILNSIINKLIYFFPTLSIDLDDIQNDLHEFFRLRIITSLEEKKIDFDIIQAVSGPSFSTKQLIEDPLDILLRANLLMNMRNNGTLTKIISVVNRATKLLDKSGFTIKNELSLFRINTSLFEKESEKNIFNVLENIQPIIDNNLKDKYEKLSNHLVNGSDVFNSFFDGKDSVMVMTDDKAVQQNRLYLLAILRSQACCLADFSKLIT